MMKRRLCLEIVRHREGPAARHVLIAALLWTPALGWPSWAQQTESLSTVRPSEAIRFFGHEKSAAEKDTVILSTVAKNYADAKAEFDGLVVELRFDLLNGQEPAKSAKFNEALKEAAKKRSAFTSFVSDKIDKLEGASAAASRHSVSPQSW